MTTKFAPLLCFCLFLAACRQVPEGGQPAAPQVTVTLAVTSTSSLTPPPTFAFTPTLIPIATQLPYPEVSDEVAGPVEVASKMNEARDKGEETVVVRDPGGHDVIVDVVPTEVSELGVWDWRYRGFVTNDDDGRVLVYRSLQSVGNKDRGQWFGVLSELETSMGLVTVECDLEETEGVVGFTPFLLQKPHLWDAVFGEVWKGKESDTVEITEIKSDATPQDVEDMKLKADLYHSDSVVRGSGLSIVLRGKNSEHYFKSYYWNNEVTVAFSAHSDAGRANIEYYAKYWFNQDAGGDLNDSHVAICIGIYDWLIHQAVGFKNSTLGLIDLADGSQNAVLRESGASYSFKAAMSAVGFEYGNASKNERGAFFTLKP